MEEQDVVVVQGRGQREGPIFRDIRRYYCTYCGISRSKKTLLNSHILSHHQEELKKDRAEEDAEGKELKSNTCEECGASFRKPAYLKQHMQSHSLERPFACPIDDCQSSYRRKDHLTRHLHQHEGKLHECPVVNCGRRFTLQSNMKRHVKEFHDETSPAGVVVDQKMFVCPEVGCGKAFKYASKLRKHEDSHVELDTAEVICSEPGCMKHFANDKCLKAHLQSCHKHVVCEICGTKQLKKNMKRHTRAHEARDLREKIKCNYKGCVRSFSTRSNLRQHVNVVHFKLRRFPCSIPGCGMRFSFKHVRDNHEKCGHHVYVSGDFEESDEQFRMRPRGGRKRKSFAVESLMRKRVVSPSELDFVLDDPPQYISWMLSSDI